MPWNAFTLASAATRRARSKVALPVTNCSAVGASEKRSAAAEKIDVLEPALDAAEAAQAGNSIEKMLCHQMVGAHFTAMRLNEKSAGDKLQPVG
jgi:hypothetical protein